MAGAFLPLLLVLAPIEVRTEGRCPLAVEVEHRLAPILPPAVVPPARNDVATLDERADGTLTLSLSGPDGTLLGRRSLPRAATCADQADTVAVTLAVWEAEIHPEIALRLDRLPPPGGAAPTTAPPAVAAVGPAVPPPAAVTTRTFVAPAPAVPAPRLGLGIAFGAAGAPAGAKAFSPVARIDLTLAFGDSRWRSRLSAVGVGEQTMAVAPGQVGWQRLFFALAAERELARFLGDRWAISLGGGPALGLIRLVGSGYAVDRYTVSFDAGLEAAARLERWFGRIKLGLAATTMVRLRSQEVAVLGPTQMIDGVLPRVEAMAVLGATFFPGR